MDECAKGRQSCWREEQKHKSERSGGHRDQQPNGRTGQKKRYVGRHGELLRFSLSPLGRAMG
jgi:hypothetical protein